MEFCISYSMSKCKGCFVQHVFRALIQNCSWTVGVMVVLSIKTTSASARNHHGQKCWCPFFSKYWFYLYRLYLSRQILVVWSTYWMPQILHVIRKSIDFELHLSSKLIWYLLQETLLTKSDEMVKSLQVVHLSSVSSL